MRRLSIGDCCLRDLLESTPLLGTLYSIIRAALGHAHKKYPYLAHLGSEYGRVTTALRDLVTQPDTRSNLSW